MERNDSFNSLRNIGISQNNSSCSLVSINSVPIDGSDYDGLDEKEEAVIALSDPRRRRPSQSVIFFHQELEDTDDWEEWHSWEKVNHIHSPSHTLSRIDDKKKRSSDERTESLTHGLEICNLEDLENEEVADIQDNIIIDPANEGTQSSSSPEHHTDGDIREDWITARDLVKVLANYPNSRTTLQTLLIKHGYNVKSVQELVHCNSRIFNLKNDMIDLRPEIFICLNHISPEGCQKGSECEGLHICPQYLGKTCNEEECSLGHNWYTHHNARVLTEFCLNDLPHETICGIVEYAVTCPSPTGPLEICREYSDNKCEKSYCRKLHICMHFVAYLAGRGFCNRGKCFLNHSFNEPSVVHRLETHGFFSKECPKDIVRTLIDANPDLLPDPMPCSLTTPGPDMPRTVWSYSYYGDVEIPEICFNSVVGVCPKEKTGCQRLHCEQYFHWQIREPNGFWLNLTRTQATSLELAYCDPAQESVQLPFQELSGMDTSVANLSSLLGRNTWQADFEKEVNKLILSSQSKVLDLRRLQCENIDEFVAGREFTWYFEDSNGIYIEYGTVCSSETDDMSDISSESLENAFQNHLGATSKIYFGNAKYTYCLDFSTMIQVNEVNQATCKVRRRPKPHLRGSR